MAFTEQASVPAAVSGPWLPVRVATTENLSLSQTDPGDEIDGVELVLGDRVLVKNQSSAGQNGIYSVRASGGLERASDAGAAGDFVAGRSVRVEEGSEGGGRTFVCGFTAPLTLGTTALRFVSPAAGAVATSTFGAGTATSQPSAPVNLSSFGI